MKYEVEQKYSVSDAAAIEERVRQLGGQPEGAQSQVDCYFAHPSCDFARTDEALRIRRVGPVNYVTYKGPKIDATTKTRREIELPLAPDEKGAQDFAALLDALGFKPVAEVRKRRRCFEIHWQDRPVEVALDEVEGLGTFVELELSADDADLSAARDCLASLARALGLSVGERRSYLELLLEASTAGRD